MCGIAGIVARDPGVRVDQDRLARMRDALHPRGPDGSGLRVDGPVGLAHTRLAIVDVARGEQPMSNESRRRLGGVQRRDLQPRRAAPGPRGERTPLPHALRGTFAFAIWDGPRHRLLLAADRCRRGFNEAVLPELLSTRFVSG